MGSLRELSNASLVLTDGLKIQVYDWSDENEDLEADCTVFFDPGTGFWFAEFDESGFRYVPARTRSSDQSFRCWSCSEDLNEHISSNGLKIGDQCPFCDAKIHWPIMSPDERSGDAP